MTFDEFLNSNHFPIDRRQLERFVSYMASEKEILELEEYVDRMLAAAVDFGKEISPVNYEQNDRSVREQLIRMLERQDELNFMRPAGNVSSAFIQNGMAAHWHKNTYFDIAYVFKGESCFFFREEKLVLKRGDVLIVPPEAEHGESVASFEDRAMTTAIRRSSFMEKFMPIFEKNGFLYSLFYRVLSGEENITYLYFHGTADAVLENLFFRLYTEQEEEAPYADEMCDTIMSGIFVHLLRYYENTVRLPAAANVHFKSEYTKIWQYISENFRTVTLEELQGKYHYSKRQLIRIIKSYTGHNFASLIKKRKLEYAKLLLLDTALPVEEIVEQCGYENASSFSRAFKEEYGMPPREYREGYRKK